MDGISEHISPFRWWWHNCSHCRMPAAAATDEASPAATAASEALLFAYPGVRYLCALGAVSIPPDIKMRTRARVQREYETQSMRRGIDGRQTRLPPPPPFPPCMCACVFVRACSVHTRQTTHVAPFNFNYLSIYKTYENGFIIYALQLRMPRARRARASKEGDFGKHLIHIYIYTNTRPHKCLCACVCVCLYLLTTDYSRHDYVHRVHERMSRGSDTVVNFYPYPPARHSMPLAAFLAALRRLRLR